MASDIALARKVYSRNELFKLAESLNDDEIDREQLNKFKETKLVYNLDVTNYEQSEESERPKLNRTLSNQQSLDRNYNQRAPLNRLSRMTSSPSLRYNRNHHLLDDHQNRNMSNSDAISVQVKAKYAELIDNLSTGNTTRRQPVTRSASLNTWQTEEQRRPAERPSTLFGPLRREVNRNYQSRRESDEPLSLPYFQTNTEASKKQATGRFMESVSDDFSHSPIKRIGSFGNSADNKGNTEGEDDDFDLNSMINITVLSDIKTIRQDFQQQQQSSFSSSQNNLSSSRLQRQSQLKGRELRGQRFGNSQRPLLTRSRTATEFNYRGRFQQVSQMPTTTTRVSASGTAVAHNDRSFAAASSHVDSAAFEAAGYESMPCTYGWQLDEQIRLGQNAQQGAQSAQKSTQEPKDEEAKKIIEAFKAQVLARAASSVDESSSVNDNQRSYTDKKSTGEKRETSKPQIEVPTDRPDANTSTDTPISKCEQNQVAPEAPKGDSKIESPKSTKTPAAGSNIPRLISLHSKAAIKPTITDVATVKTTATTTTKQTTETPAAAAQQRKTAPITRSTSVSSKFVSQYRQLRGKSLADELGDSSK